MPYHFIKPKRETKKKIIVRPLVSVDRLEDVIRDMFQLCWDKHKIVECTVKSTYGQITFDCSSDYSVKNFLESENGRYIATHARF